MATASSSGQQGSELPIPGTPSPEQPLQSERVQPCRVARRVSQPQHFLPFWRRVYARVGALPFSLRAWLLCALLVVLARPLAVTVRVLSGVLRLCIRRLLELLFYILDQHLAACKSDVSPPWPPPRLWRADSAAKGTKRDREGDVIDLSDS
eukprot:s7583_g3.t1